MNIEIPTTSTKFIVGQKVEVPVLNLDEAMVTAIEWRLKLIGGGTTILAGPEYLLSAGTIELRLSEHHLREIEVPERWR